MDSTLYRQIDAIIARTDELGILASLPRARLLTLPCALLTCHSCGCPLNWRALLTCTPSDLRHDLLGIGDNICRRTGTLLNNFVPRHALSARVRYLFAITADSKKLSKRTLAKALGKDVRTIQRWASGAIPITAADHTRIQKIATTHGVGAPQ